MDGVEQSGGGCVLKLNISSSKTCRRAKAGGAKDRALAAFGCCTTEYRHSVLRKMLQLGG